MRRTKFRVRLILLCSLLATAAAAGCAQTARHSDLMIIRPAPRPVQAPIRAVWVARFHYRFPDDIRSIMRNCKQLGFNTVLWQVRGNGTVAFRSRLEPWAEEFGFQDPGFDPLAVAVQEAHRNDLRIEAWVNVMPGWKGKTPPPVPDQLYNAHPDWFLSDESGDRQPLGDFYVILNPCLPEVRRHIVGVVQEVLNNYEVDGIHLDYVRYAWETSKDARQRYPRDPVTLRLFQQQTGKRPDDDPRAWDDWRANQLTRLVEEIRDRLNKRRPGATLTAATWADPAVGYHDYFQNAVGWLRTGLIDAAYPMAYTADAAEFERHVTAYQTAAPQARIVPGIGLYKHTSQRQTAAQLESCRQWGGEFAVFSYDSLYATAGDRAARPAELAKRNGERQMRRSVLAASAGL